MSKREKCEVVGYSERGMVNELVHLVRSDENPVGIVKELLSECAFWAGDNVQDLPESSTPTTGKIAAEVSGILENMDEVTLVVESGCAHFGDPDLIIVPKLRGKRLALFFVEAKVVSYAHSANLCKDPLDMSQKGFNSTIIGQLTLRYRLSRALASRSRQAWRNHEPLKESERFFELYSDMEKGKRRHVRSLAKQANLKHLLRELDLQSSSESLWEKRCYFVALTGDRDYPFVDEYALYAKSVPAGYNVSSPGQDIPVIPHYYKPGPSGKTYSANAIQRTGWMGWDRIKGVFEGQLKKHRLFDKTWKLAFTGGALEGAGRSHGKNVVRVAIQTIAWSRSSAQVSGVREYWKESYLANRVGSEDSMLGYAQYAGSDSGQFGAQTVFKLLNLQNGFAVALREDTPASIDPSFDQYIAIQGVPFRMRMIPDGNPDSEVQALVSGYVEELR